MFTNTTEGTHNEHYPGPRYNCRQHATDFSCKDATHQQNTATTEHYKTTTYLRICMHTFSAVLELYEIMNSVKGSKNLYTLYSITSSDISLLNNCSQKQYMLTTTYKITKKCEKITMTMQLVRFAWSLTLSNYELANSAHTHPSTKYKIHHWTAKQKKPQQWQSQWRQNQLTGAHGHNAITVVVWRPHERQTHK